MFATKAARDAIVQRVPELLPYMSPGFVAWHDCKVLTEQLLAALTEATAIEQVACPNKPYTVTVIRAVDQCNILVCNHSYTDYDLLTDMAH